MEKKSKKIVDEIKKEIEKVFLRLEEYRNLPEKTKEKRNLWSSDEYEYILKEMNKVRRKTLSLLLRGSLSTAEAKEITFLIDILSRCFNDEAELKYIKSV